MFIIHVKTRGKVIRTPAGDIVRTPRKIKVLNQQQLDSLLMNMRTQCIYDYEITEDVDGVIEPRELSKRMKYTTSDASISIGGKITAKRGG